MDTIQPIGRVDYANALTKGTSGFQTMRMTGAKK